MHDQPTLMRIDASPIVAGSVLGSRQLVDVAGTPIQVPDADRIVHLQFRRFAGCPICNLHLRTIALRHDEIVVAGVREVVLFHSDAASLREYVVDVPFSLVADPEKRLYAEFGVETSARAVLSPRAWAAGMRGAVVAGKRPWAGDRRTGVLGLPADFLIAPDGEVLAARHAGNAYDQWSADELLATISDLASSRAA
jgi:peroxiredoxin